MNWLDGELSAPHSHGQRVAAGWRPSRDHDAISSSTYSRVAECRAHCVPRTTGLPADVASRSCHCTCRATLSHLNARRDREREQRRQALAYDMTL